jgi:hemolysin activation/secretion protein
VVLPVGEQTPPAAHSNSKLFFTKLQGTTGRHLDLDNQLLLGGDNGLRGYPLRYQGGDAVALLTLEQRYFSDWYVLRRFRVGGAVFFDAGRTWGTVPFATPGLGSSAMADSGCVSATVGPASETYSTSIWHSRSTGTAASRRRSFSSRRRSASDRLAGWMRGS